MEARVSCHIEGMEAIFNNERGSLTLSSRGHSWECHRYLQMHDYRGAGQASTKIESPGPMKRLSTKRVQAPGDIAVRWRGETKKQGTAP